MAVGVPAFECVTGLLEVIRCGQHCTLGVEILLYIVSFIDCSAVLVQCDTVSRQEVGCDRDVACCSGRNHQDVVLDLDSGRSVERPVEQGDMRLCRDCKLDRLILIADRVDIGLRNDLSSVGLGDVDLVLSDSEERSDRDVACRSCRNDQVLH